jgi:hypothetical protein
MLAISAMVHREAALLQPARDKGGDLFVIFHNQDSHKGRVLVEARSCNAVEESPRGK